MNERRFTPKSIYIGRSKIATRIKFWTWTRREGLRVVYTDGQEAKSEYTLPQLIRSGEAVEVDL